MNAALAAKSLQRRDRGPATTASMAASAIRKILKGDGDINRNANENPDPMDGWSEEVSLTKSHYCLLLKPQIVLQGETPREACIVAASQAKLQSFAIMDLANFDDPVSGKVMSRYVDPIYYSECGFHARIHSNYTSLTGFQAFAPLESCRHRVTVQFLLKF